MLVEQHSRERREFYYFALRQCDDFELNLDPLPDDGVILATLKRSTWLLRLYHRFIFVRLLIWIDRACDSAFGNKTKGEIARWLRALDCYLFILTVCLVATCSWTWVMYYFLRDSAWSVIGILVPVLFVIWRAYEIIGLQTSILGNRKYRPKNQIRALLNTLWHIVEVVIIFATLYVATAVGWDDSFKFSSSNGFRTPIEPLYFSAVTVTTLGYGDITPNGWISQTLVVLELGFGIFLLTLVFQRAMNQPGSHTVEIDYQI